MTTKYEASRSASTVSLLVLVPHVYSALFSQISGITFKVFLIEICLAHTKASWWLNFARYRANPLAKLVSSRWNSKYGYLCRRTGSNLICRGTSNQSESPKFSIFNAEFEFLVQLMTLLMASRSLHVIHNFYRPNHSWYKANWLVRVCMRYSKTKYVDEQLTPELQ